MMLRNRTNLKSYLSTLGILLLFTANIPAVAYAGWTLSAATMRPPASSSGAPSLITMASSNRIKYATRAWAQVVNLSTQRLLIINHLSQTFWEGPLDEYLPVVTAQTEAMRAALVNRLSPEQRTRIEKLSGPFDTFDPTLTVTVQPSTEEDTIAGYKAQKYLVLRNGQAYEETWIAEEIHFAAEVDPQQFTAFVNRLQKARTTPPGVVLAEMTELVAKGYPVKTVNLLSGVTKTIVQNEQGTIPESEFTAPQNYTAKSLQEVTAPQPVPKRSSP
jgi:uncharacterized protein DUF4412